MGEALNSTLSDLPSIQQKYPNDIFRGAPEPYRHGGSWAIPAISIYNDAGWTIGDSFTTIVDPSEGTYTSAFDIMARA